MKVLITDISSFKAIVFCQALAGLEDLEILTSDHRKYTQNLRTKFSHKHFITSDPAKNPEQFAKQLSSIVAKEHVDFLIPINSVDIRVCLSKKEKFGKALDCFGTFETFEDLDNKEKLYKLAADLGIRVPRSYAFDDNDKKFPLVLKPSVSSSSKGVSYLKNASELKKKILEIKNPKQYVLQEYVEGEGVGYSVVSKNGQVLAGFGHKRIAEFPVSGGSSTIRSNFDHPDMKPIAAKIIDATGWSGFAMLEFKLDSRNNLVLLEINPRVWGSVNQGIQNGVNFPKILLFGQSKAQKPKNEIITYLSPLNYLSFLGYALKLNFSSLWFFIKNLTNVKADVSIWSDFGGYLSLILRSFSR